MAQKWAKGLNRHFSKEDIQMANKQMLNITHNQINANQNHNEISHDTCQNGYYKKETPHLVRMWIKGNTDTHCWWE